MKSTQFLIQIFPLLAHNTTRRMKKINFQFFSVDDSFCSACIENIKFVVVGRWSSKFSSGSGCFVKYFFSISCIFCSPSSHNSLMPRRGVKAGGESENRRDVHLDALHNKTTHRKKKSMMPTQMLSQNFFKKFSPIKIYIVVLLRLYTLFFTLKNSRHLVRLVPSRRKARRGWEHMENLYVLAGEGHEWDFDLCYLGRFNGVQIHKQSQTPWLCSLFDTYGNESTTDEIQGWN